MSSVSEVFYTRRTEIRRVGELAERFGAAEGLSEDDVMMINLVLDELVANVISHGHDDDGKEHEIHVTLALEGAELTMVVEDDGRAFDPLQRPAPDLDLPLEERPIGGLGIHIVRSLMDSVEYRHENGRNVLTMHKTIGRN
jgi:anti-sigma regulatory factor (Ser/Thr protein kinase)